MCDAGRGFWNRARRELAAAAWVMRPCGARVFRAPGRPPICRRPADTRRRLLVRGARRQV
eukprot:13648483-Alexandrium_andersonii.AAC.1